MRIATRIQTGILPKTHEVAGLEISAVMLPAEEVGGDYFDVLPFDGGSWLGIGDVAGHGLPTGLVMLMIQGIVAAATHRRPEARPAQVWETVNAVLFENVRERLEQDEFASLTLIRYEQCGRLTFAGAHEDLIIYRAASGRCELVATPGTWAGAKRQLQPGVIIDSELLLYPGDVLLLYTDGVTEARNQDREMFGVGRLTETLERVAARPVEQIRDHIVATVRGWAPVQADDLTVVVLRYAPG
jgi:sigma-B regulation protein RsbU (phosphoserine phosphatase)